MISAFFSMSLCFGVVLVLIHLFRPGANLRCHDVTHVDPGARSHCHSNVTEIKAVFFLFFHLLINIFLVSVASLVSVVSFRSFRLFRFARFISLFRVLVNAIARGSYKAAVTIGQITKPLPLEKC